MIMVQRVCLLLLACESVQGAINAVVLNYPQVRKDDDVIDDYHGTKISDPYRWLEDPDSDETKCFVQTQNSLTRAYLEEAPFRKEIRDKLTEAWNYTKRSVLQRRGNKYFYSVNSGLQNQRYTYNQKHSTTTPGMGKMCVLMVQNSLTDTPRVFFDPNLLSPDGTISIQRTSFSENGELFAYSLAQSGSDWVTIHTKNVSTGENFPEILREIKLSTITWTHDNRGFFYTRFVNNKTSSGTGTETDEKGQQKIYYHKVGTPQTEDPLVVEFNDKPKLWVSVKVSNGGKYLIVQAFEVIIEGHAYFSPLEEALKTNFKNKMELTPINSDQGYMSYVTNDESLFYFVTEVDAPNGKLVRIDVNKPGQKHWYTIIPESNQVLDSVIPIHHHMMFVYYKKDVKSNLELRYLQNGTLIKEFPLVIGSIDEASGKREDSEFFYKLITFTDPGVIYRVDLSKNDYEPSIFTETPLKINTSAIDVDQVFYKSKDGTTIPMYILHRSDLVLDGNAPAFLYGYGGFSLNMEPWYSIFHLIFVEHFRGIVAIPSIRGGGEYGKEWWDDGRLLKKQNCFDDFAAAAEYLVAHNYSNPSKLAINGASNGGLLVATTVNQRPELFGAAIPDVGLMDMLRFQKFTGGYYWCGEYGCSENRTHFDNLLTYSPLHNIRMPTNESVQYPAILVKTADHDSRVVPLHSYKYIAELQKNVGFNKGQTNPLLIRIEENDGHGTGTPTNKRIDQNVDEYAFLVRALNLKFYK